MWPAGLIALLLVAMALSQLLVRGTRVGPALPLWDIPRVTGSYTTIVGTLAGFTVASAVFIANQPRESPFFEDAMGMFIIAFLLLIASTMQFAATPNLAGEMRREYLGDQHLSYATANSSFYLGVAISWLGLRLLLLAVDFNYFAEILTWLLLFSIVVGSSRLSMHIYRHTTLPARACFSVPIIGISMALLYRFGATELVPDLWPDENQPLLLATSAFFVGGLAYTFQTLLLTLHGHPTWEGIMDRFGPRWLLGYTQSVTLIISLLWIAVAEA